MATKKSMRSQLISAWELVKHSAIPATVSEETVFPLGPDARGIIMYTPDGYMLAQLLQPNEMEFARAGRDGSEGESAQVGRNCIAYTGRFYLDESSEELELIHMVQVVKFPSLLGDRQRVLATTAEEGGRFLILVLDSKRLAEMGYKWAEVRCRRLANNQATSPTGPKAREVLWAVLMTGAMMIARVN